MKNTIHIFYYRHEENLKEEIFQQFLSALPVSFQDEIRKYKFRNSAESSLLGKIILKYGFQKLKLNYYLQDLKSDAKERPFIQDDLDFNISHSGNYIICAISQNSRVGIDIEKHRILKTNIADRYFDSNECREIEIAIDSSKAFFDLWSLKESAIKCDGRGVEVLSKTHKQYESENRNTVFCDRVTFHYKQLEIEPFYSCCVCSNVQFDVELQQLNLDDVLNTRII